MSQKSLKLSDIKQPLSMRTHAEKFHKLLFWEEIEHEKILKERSGLYSITYRRR